MTKLRCPYCGSYDTGKEDPVEIPVTALTHKQIIQIKENCGKWCITCGAVWGGKK